MGHDDAACASLCGGKETKDKKIAISCMIDVRVMWEGFRVSELSRSFFAWPRAIVSVHPAQ